MGYFGNGRMYLVLFFFFVQPNVSTSTPNSVSKTSTEPRSRGRKSTPDWRPLSIECSRDALTTDNTNRYFPGDNASTH